MIYEILCNGKLHYTRPEGHPDIQEALDLIERSNRLFGVSAYEVRPTPATADTPPAICQHGVNTDNQICSACDPNNPAFR